MNKCDIMKNDIIIYNFILSFQKRQNSVNQINISSFRIIF